MCEERTLLQFICAFLRFAVFKIKIKTLFKRSNWCDIDWILMCHELKTAVFWKDQVSHIVTNHELDNTNSYSQNLIVDVEWFSRFTFYIGRRCFTFFDKMKFWVNFAVNMSFNFDSWYITCTTFFLFELK